MSKRFENGYFALVLTGALALLSIAFISYIFAFSKGYQSADREHSAFYAKRDATEVAYSECLSNSSSLDSAKDCINNAKDISRESERSEQDLNIQREMAHWAEGALWAAWLIGLATIGITTIGVRYVYLTLIATQQMVVDTRALGEAQTRAWLGIEITDIAIRPYFYEGHKRLAFTVRLAVVNQGNSVAGDVRFSWLGDIIADGDNPDNFLDRFNELPEKKLHSVVPNLPKGARADFNLSEADILKNPDFIGFGFWGRLSYVSVGQKETKSVDFYTLLANIDGPHTKRIDISTADWIKRKRDGVPLLPLVICLGHSARA